MEGVVCFLKRSSVVMVIVGGLVGGEWWVGSGLLSDLNGSFFLWEGGVGGGRHAGQSTRAAIDNRELFGMVLHCRESSVCFAVNRMIIGMLRCDLGAMNGRAQKAETVWSLSAQDEFQ